jgi:glutamyl-tRNA synthetase
VSAAAGTPAAPVRVRIAPSPTGVPHVGFLRTALFNWAYARHTGGTFVLRIEDTDLARHSEESYAQMVEALRWLGLDWDEGVEVGGPHAPYRQSQRSELYADVLRRLVEGGWVYESFSTPEEVEARHRAAGRDPQRGYDNADRGTTPEQAAAFRAQGREPVWRLRMPDEEIVFDDLVRGEVRFPAGSIPDYVVARADGTPLYTLVNPVDDALMEITHVLRGEDLLSSTPRQVALYAALTAVGVARGTPAFGHLPYVMGEGNRKLSKRDPESNLFVHRERGFLPEGLLNYLALLGWSIAPDRDVFTPAEMVAAFDIADVVASPARFDLRKAEAINGAHVRMLEPEDFRDRLVPYLRDAGLVGEHPTAEQLALLTAAAPLLQERMTLLGEAPGMLGFLLRADADLVLEPDAVASLRPEAAEVLDASVRVLGDLDGWTAAGIEAALRGALVDELGIKPKFAFAPLRVAVTGRRVSPPLFESLELLGRESSLARLSALRAGLAG